MTTPRAPAEAAVSAPDLAAALDDATARARAAWPELGLPAADFHAWLRARLDGDDAAEVASLAAADLYLACACVAGLPAALHAFEAGYLAGLPVELGRVDIPASVAGEVEGVLRERLLVGAAGVRPGLCEYRGAGELRAWIRVVAVRTAVSLLRRGRREVPLSDSLAAAVPLDGDDPELQHLKALYRHEFRVAFAEALATLAPRGRNLLRHHYLHGLNIDQIGAIYRVHRATAARWIDEQRNQLATATRARLIARLDVDAVEVESILRFIRSQLDVGLRTHLTEHEE